MVAAAAAALPRRLSGLDAFPEQQSAGSAGATLIWSHPKDATPAAQLPTCSTRGSNEKVLKINT